MSEKICVTGYGQTIYFKKPTFDYAQMCIGSDNLIHAQVLNTSQDKWKLKKWNKETGIVIGSERNTATYFDLVPIANEVSKFSVGDEVLWGDYAGKIKELSSFSKFYSTYLVSFPDHRDMYLGDDVLTLIPAKKETVKCDGRWNDHYIDATQEAYDLLIADGYIDKMSSKIIDGCKYLAINENSAIIQYVALGNHYDYFSKQMYIVDGKLSATQYSPNEVGFKSYKEEKVSDAFLDCDIEDLPNAFTVAEDKSFVVGSQYKHLKCDTVEWSKQNHTLEQQKAICQFMINKYSMRKKEQDADDIVKIKFYVEWLEQIVKRYVA